LINIESIVYGEGWSNINAKQPPKAAWSMVCLPKEEGGLGVLNLKDTK
jgi:hypothetical protein